MSPSIKILSLLPAFFLPIVSCSAQPDTVRAPHLQQVQEPDHVQGLDHSSDRRSASIHEIPYLGAPDGLSGLARDIDGRLWAVSETSHQLVVLDVLSRLPSRALDIHGVPAGLELESIAFLDDGSLAIGTESEDDDRSSDLVLFATRAGDGFEVRSSLDVPYGLWDLHSASDEGIEAICAADGLLVVASETVIEDDSGRTAPLGIYDLESGTWRAARLPLTSLEGKISGLACRSTGLGEDSGDRADIEFIAIERHFNVRRGLRWTMANDVAAGPGDQALTMAPTIFFDISQDSADNLEGIEWIGPEIGPGIGHVLGHALGHGTSHEAVAMVTDNYFRSERSGLGKLLMVAQATR